jgi:hypothetical protein
MNLLQREIVLLAALHLGFMGAVSAAPYLPAGLTPSAKYHLLFNSSTSTHGLTSTVSFYNQFVQSAANAAGIGTSAGVTWSALVSTPSINARTSAVAAANTPIYNTHGNRIATGFADLWDGQLTAGVAWDEYGAANTGDAWTGSLGTGLGDPNYTVGNSAPTFAAWCGHPEATDGMWMAHMQPTLNTFLHVYALSEELTVPQPGDFDGDFDVDGRDLLSWQRGLGTTRTAADLATWRTNFGAKPIVSAHAAVPEPSTGLRAALFVLVIGTRQWKRRNAQLGVYIPSKTALCKS